jgi:hypothetical protein
VVDEDIGIYEDRRAIFQIGKEHDQASSGRNSGESATASILLGISTPPEIDQQVKACILIILNIEYCQIALLPIWVKPATHSGGKFTTFQVISGMPKIISNHPFPFKIR